MPSNRTIILADDLTGANDTAIQFVKQGLSALVITHMRSSEPVVFNGYDVIAINSDSRGMSAEDAYQTVRETMGRLDAVRNGYFIYKKIDSVLRGNPGKELAAVMDEMDLSLAVVAPSFPANRSVLEHGILSSGGESGGKSDVDTVKVFAAGTGRKVENIPLEEIRRGSKSAAEYIRSRHAEGTQVFVTDAVTDEDLEIIYRTSSLLKEPHVVAGAAALAGQFAKDPGREKINAHTEWVEGFKSAAQNCAPVLVIAGTRQGETTAQITTLSKAMSTPIIRFKVALVDEGKSGAAVDAALNEAAGQMKGNPGLCIVAVESMFRSEVPAGNVDRNYAEDDDTGCAISEALGLLTEKLLNRFQFPALVSTGGDTSLGICQRLGTRGIEPIAEICPGIPVGKIAGGDHEGKFIITKSGRFGDKNSLVEIMHYLGVRQ
jgi:uncharacterized protein YgbK (DUF1537 family)